MYNPTLLNAITLRMMDGVSSLLLGQATKTAASGDAEPAAAAASAAAATGEAARYHEGIYSHPPAESTIAEFSDNVAAFIHIVEGIFFILIILFMGYFAWKYRRKNVHQKALSQVGHNTVLELTWTIPPLIIVFFMFYYGFVGFMDFSTLPDNAYTVKATAKKWSWTFQHPNGRIDSVLHVPAGEPVVIQIESLDVLHGLYLPFARVKRDAVPGRKTYIWFEALTPTPHTDLSVPLDEAEVDAQLVEAKNWIDAQQGLYDPEDGGLHKLDSILADGLGGLEFKDLKNLKEKQDLLREYKLQRAGFYGHTVYCAEFCGTDHSNMYARAVVYPKGWRPPAQLLPKDPVLRGKFFFTSLGCAGCHQVNPGGTTLAGPTFAGGIFGKQETMVDGSTVTIDEAYVHESIVAPSAKVVRGYAAGQMPNLGPSEDQIKDIIAYLHSLGEKKAENGTEKGTE